MAISHPFAGGARSHRAPASDSGLAFDQHGDALADADTEADQGVAAAGALKLAQGGERHAHAGSAQRVADGDGAAVGVCLLYTSPSPRDKRQSRMPSSA